MMKTGPSDGPWVSPGSDPVAAFRKLVVWASSNKIWDPACYGRLFVTRRGHKDVLVELRSNEDCTDKYHVQWRAEEPDGEFCDADCGGTFTVTEIKSLAMLESYIVRKKLHVFYLPPDEEWARWFWFDYDIETGAQAAGVDRPALAGLLAAAWHAPAALPPSGRLRGRMARLRRADAVLGGKGA